MPPAYAGTWFEPATQEPAESGKAAVDSGLAEEIEGLIAKRAEARKNKDWAAADAIRDELAARHVVVKDTPQGVQWHIEN